VLYATPHVSPVVPLTAARERTVRAAFEELRELAPLELRLGYELTPWRALLREEPSRYALEGTEAVLVEVPFLGPADGFLALAEHIEAAARRAPRANAGRPGGSRSADTTGRARLAAAGQRDEPAGPARPGSGRDRPAPRRGRSRRRRRVGRPPADPAAAPGRRLRAGEAESGGGSRCAVVRRQRGHIRATASISRSRARRLSASVSIWRTRSRVNPSRRPISSSVFGSESSRP